MLNTSLPLEQLPHPQQLYGGGEGWGGGGAGSAQVPAMSGQLPGLFWRAVSGGRVMAAGGGAGEAEPRSSRTP